LEPSNGKKSWLSCSIWESEKSQIFEEEEKNRKKEENERSRCQRPVEVME
jgi:hypothetical protein